jgi:organic radical activating enzyme
LSSEITPGRPLRAYTEDNIYLDMSTETIVGSKKNYFKDWSCGAGVESIYVDMDGRIFVASCRVGGELGHIDSHLNVPTDWITCTREVCSCGADLFIPKVKSSEFKSLLQKTEHRDKTARPAGSDRPEGLEFVAMERMFDSKIPQIYWEIGRFCNYDCSYCWPFIHNKTDPHKSFKRLINGTLLIEEKFIRGRKAHFVISGGEPTLNPAFMDWVKFIHSMGHNLSVHSNGSRLPKYYRELIHYTNFNLSVHFEYYKADKLTKVIEAVTEEKAAKQNRDVGHFEVKLMMKPGTTKEALDFERRMKEIPHFTELCTWAIVPIRDGKKGDLIADGYTESDFELFGDRV